MFYPMCAGTASLAAAVSKMSRRGFIHAVSNEIRPLLLRLELLVRSLPPRLKVDEQTRSLTLARQGKVNQHSARAARAPLTAVRKWE